MRIRAGIVLIKENKVALIERHRGGLHYFVFPGGGVDEGESPEQAAIREAMEELGVEVSIKQMVAEVSLGPRSRQVYFLVEQTGGEFGTGTGEEFAPTNLDDPRYGVYTPIWIPVSQLMQYTNIYPSAVAELVTKSLREGWASGPIYASETPQ